MQKVLVVVGPTASGKSALGVRLAKRLNGEVISADSRQVYKGLDMGTGKITKKEMQGIPHHLLDVAPPSKIFTAGDFRHQAGAAIEQILERMKLPIVVGGTGFYIDALLGRVQLGSVPADNKLRARLRKKTAAKLFALLQKKNPDRAKAMNASDRQNPVRLIRALEISAQPRRNFKQGDALLARRPLAQIWIGLRPDNSALRRKIRTRLLARMKMGMLAEARRLHARGLSWKRMEELGLEYRYLAMYLQDKVLKDEMLKQLEAKIWQYAKRQMTYWRRNKDIHWFDTPKAVEVWLKENF